jgi:hypothetical protein
MSLSLNDYRQRYADIYQKIQTAEQELRNELAATKTVFDRLYQRQQEIDKRWFVANLNFFLKHKKHFTSDFGLSQIIVDFLTLYHFGGLVGGAGFGSDLDVKITIKDLLTLWDEGFTYKGYPIIAYEKYVYHGFKIKITYVKNCRIEVVSTDYLRTKNPLELPKELMEKVRKANLAFKYQYQSWQTYKTIDVVRNVLNKKESGDEVDKK